MNPVPSQAVRFGTFELDLGTGELRKRGIRIRVPEQSIQILTALVLRPGELVTREEIRTKLWPDDTVVEFDSSIGHAVWRLRQALGDTAQTPRFIETFPKKGYRFICPPSPGNGSQDLALVHEAPTVTRACEGGEGPVVPTLPDTAASVDPVVSSPQTSQAPRKNRVRQLTLMLALAIFAVGVLVQSRHLHWFIQPGPKHITSLAVLPLENLSGAPGQDYFADGMTDELISDLGNISALRVISRTSVMRYRRTQTSVQEIARDLRVDAVVEGTVLRSGDRVRVTAHLIEAEPEAHLWTGKYERDLRDVMVLQDELARQIATEIRVKLTPQEQIRLTSAHPISPRAHEAYLKGRYLFNERTDESMEKSIGFLQQAIDADPRYALAYAGLADSYCVLATYGLLRPGQAFPKAEKAATKALELDDTLAEAHTALGYAQSCYHRDWQAAEREFRRALDLNPNYATAHLWHGEYLRTVGNGEGAVAEFRRARELDPLSLILNSGLGRMLRDARHFDEAIEQCRKTIELDPNFAHGHWCLGLAYLGKKRYEEAIGEFQKARALGERAVALWSLAYAYGVAGRESEAREALSELGQQSRDGYVSPYFMAGIYAGLGEKDRAFEWLDRAYKEHDFMSLKLDPFLDSLRSDPRFRELLRRMNLPG